VTFKGTPATCEGDSGGPLLIQRNGVESLAAVHSYGDSKKCDGTSFDMRADVDLVGFIDPIIAKSDPGFVAPSDGSDTGAGGSGGGGGGGGMSAGVGGSGSAVTTGGDSAMPASSGCNASRSPLDCEWAWVGSVLTALAFALRRRRRDS
jgi:hypothetical protein